MDKNYDVINFISKNLFLSKPGVAIFADIIKIVTTFFKIIFKNSRNVKRIRDYVSVYMQSISVFLDIAKFPDVQ